MAVSSRRTSRSRRRSVTGVFAVRHDAGRVVPEGRVFDHEAPARVRARVADRVVFDRRVVDPRFAFPAGADVDARVVVAGGVDVFPVAFLLVLGEDPVAAVEARVVRGQVACRTSRARPPFRSPSPPVHQNALPFGPSGVGAVVVARRSCFRSRRCSSFRPGSRCCRRAQLCSARRGSRCCGPCRGCGCSCGRFVTTTSSS